jgi:N-acyl-L-homoserine lactone synthetase
MLKHSGLNIHRLARAMKVGDVLTVACFIEVDEITLRAINFPEHEIPRSGPLSS